MKTIKVWLITFLKNLKQKGFTKYIVPDRIVMQGS